jgi:hypothetical protein
MSNIYSLVNPHIEGSFDKQTKAKNSIEAASNIYKELSSHFNNNIPKFHFTLKKGTKYYHFKVNEKKNNDDVHFTMEPFNINENNLKQFTENLKSIQTKLQKGGKKSSKKSSKKHSKKSKKYDSSSESDEEIYEKRRSVLDYWWYDPYVYSLDYFYVPTFSVSTPYVLSPTSYYITTSSSPFNSEVSASDKTV